MTVPALLESLHCQSTKKLSADLKMFLRSRFRFPSGRAPNMLYGLDAQLLSALAVGAEGAVGSTYNFNGYLEGKVFEYYKKGDLATAGSYQVGV